MILVGKSDAKVHFGDYRASAGRVRSGTNVQTEQESAS